MKTSQYRKPPIRTEIGALGKRPITLNVKRVTVEEIEKNWGIPFSLRTRDTTFYARCNAQGEINWEKTSIYDKEELHTKSNFKILNGNPADYFPNTPEGKLAHAEWEVSNRLNNLNNLRKALNKTPMPINDITGIEHLIELAKQFSGICNYVTLKKFDTKTLKEMAEQGINYLEAINL